MASLKLLVGKLSGRFFKEAMIILRRGFVLAQMIISRGPQKVSDRKFGEDFRPCVEHPDYEFIILGFVGCTGQFAITG